MQENEQYYEPSEELQNYIKDIWVKLDLEESIKYKIIGDNKQKTLITAKKLSALYQYLSDCEILISVNEEVFEGLDEDEIRKILIEQELSRISVNLESGKIKIEKVDLQTTSFVVKRYDAEKVVRANIVLNELNNQTEDAEENGEPEPLGYVVP